MAMFKKEIQEREVIVKRSESMSATINGWWVFFHRSEDGDTTTVSLSPEKWDRFRLPAFQCHPKCVSDLEGLADVVGDLLRQIAAGLREAGEDDLRSRYDRMSDENDERMERIRADIEAGSK